MIDEKAIVIKGLNKEYYKKTSLKSKFLEKLNPKANTESFFALKDINLEINKGEIIGIIGPNGAGKSTLLKILAEVTPPTSGEIEINGKVASILEIGIGFQPDLSGYENIFLSGRLYGLSKKQIKSKLEEIIEMFGFPDFINTAVKYYSSGMYMRLAFAIITNIEADIYLFDEILSVGDLGFQSKVIKELEKLKNNGATILIVTHMPMSIYQICNKMVLINLGQIDFEGTPNKATLLFKEILDKNRDVNISISNSINEQSLKTIKKSEISSEIADFNLSNFSISNSLDNITKTINYDKDIYIKLNFSYYFPEDVNIILTLVDMHWNIISTHYIKLPPSKKIIKKEITLLIEKNTLNEIKLMFSLIVANLNGELIISYKDLLEIKLVGDSNISKVSGYVNLPIKIIN